jgi:hypothetical protein
MPFDPAITLVGIYVKELKSVLQLNVLSLDDKSDKTEAY